MYSFVFCALEPFALLIRRSQYERTHRKGYTVVTFPAFLALKAAASGYVSEARIKLVALPSCERQSRRAGPALSN
jgi:hypothetical protein